MYNCASILFNFTYIVTRPSDHVKLTSLQLKYSKIPHLMCNSVPKITFYKKVSYEDGQIRQDPNHLGYIFSRRLNLQSKQNYVGKPDLGRLSG